MSGSARLRASLFLAVGICILGLPERPASLAAEDGSKLLPYAMTGEARFPGDVDREAPCHTELRYDDGTDETPGWAPALFWIGDQIYQALSVRFTTPEQSPHLVESAYWIAPAWERPGWIDVVAYEADCPGNAATDSIWVGGPGTWEVAFSTPIEIQPGEDYFVALCPRFNTAGLILDDSSQPDGRSFYGLEPAACDPQTALDYDLAIWSCVRPSFPVPVQFLSWGQVKHVYR